MRESVTYQAVLEEGREEGIEKGRVEGRVEERRSMIINFLREGVSIELIAKATGLPIADITQLQQENI
jgi:predicted transposase/invertase (TIGR01784 family)